MALLFRFGIGAALAIPAAVLLSPAQAATPIERDFCKETPQQRAVSIEAYHDLSAIKCSPETAKPSAAAAKTAQPSQVAKSDSPKKNPAGGGGNPSTPTGPLSYMVRSSWSDAGLLGSPCFQPPPSADKSSNGPPGNVSASQAKGASASFTRDYAGNNKIWAAQAMGAVVYTDCANANNIYPVPGGGSSGFVERSIAAYAQVNSDYNSNVTFAKKNNVDTRTAGLSGEVMYLSGGNYNVFRFTPNVVFDNIKGTTVVAAELQYIPILLPIHGWWSSYSIGTATFQFDPTLDLQYASATGHSAPLKFSGKDQSLRLGPELTFFIKPLDLAGNFLSNLGFTETFHPWYEAYSGRGSYWWANSVFYNITPDGNFAIALSYNRGLDENSGTMTNQYIASLTGKY
jgi:hypothetical protein